MTERYELINREEGSYPISSMCRWSRVSKSGYYSWRDRPQSQTAVRREELAIMIKDVFEDSDGTYGYRRIQVVLERRGVRADGSTIRAIMRDLGLQAAGPRAKVRTTVPAQDLDERPDLLRQDFTTDEPGKKLCGDIPPQAGGAPSYVRTWAGFIYLATVLDCCTNKVVGYAMGDHMHTSLVCQAIDMAVRRCPIKKGVTIVHSDRGGAPMWCVKRRRVVSWLVVGRRGLHLGSWRAGSGCGGGPGRGRPGYGVCLGLVCAGSRPGRRGRSAGRRRRTGTWRA